MKTVFHFFLALGLITACKKDPVVEPVQQLHYFTINSPQSFPDLLIPADNPTSAEGVALGRRLYYDPILSGGSNSCSSCHLQSNGFSNPTVNSLAHVNIGWQQYFLWNGKISGTLENAMLFEVEEFFATNISDLQNNTYYRNEFKKVFKVDQITSKEVAYALAQFTRTMISSDSKFDKYLRGELMLNTSEMNGMDIFFTERGDCFHCHSQGLFTDNSFHNNGLDLTFSSINWGRYEVTGSVADIGKYKTPSLRNAELTAPYMHDGRFATLEEVVEFYNSQVNQTQYADPIMTKPGKEFGLQLSVQDKADLVAFLKTLTDLTYINNPDFSHP